MDYICLSILDSRFYQTIHFLQICSGCSITYCSCIEKLLRCDNKECNVGYCSNCISRRRLLLKSDFCRCRLCINCGNQEVLIISEHGSICRTYKNMIKIMLHQVFNADTIDYLSDFLWNK